MESIHLIPGAASPLPSWGSPPLSSEPPAQPDLQSDCFSLPIHRGWVRRGGWSCGREKRGRPLELNYCSSWAARGNEGLRLGRCGEPGGSHREEEAQPLLSL